MESPVLDNQLLQHAAKKFTPKKRKNYTREDVKTIVKNVVNAIKTERELGLLSGKNKEVRTSLSEHDKGFNRAKKLIEKALLQAF